MSDDTWTGAPGDWSVGSNWSTGAPPTPSSDVSLTYVGHGPTLTGVVIDAQTDATAQSITLNGSNLTVDGALSVGGDVMLNDSGKSYGGSTLELLGGTVDAQAVDGAGEVYGYGTLDAGASGYVDLVAAGGHLTVEGGVEITDVPSTIEAGATLELAGPASLQVGFDGQGGVLQLDAPTAFSGSIQYVDPADVIDLRGVVATGVSYDGSTLTVDYGANQVLSLAVSGDPNLFPSLTDDLIRTTGDGAGGTDIAWVAHSATPPVIDFNGDGLGDLMWVNAATSQVSEWTSAGSGFHENTFLDTFPSGWAIAAAGDFDGDGRSDLMWFNAAAHQVSTWTSTGSGFDENTFAAYAPAGWTIAAAGDFNGDAKSDLAWFNGASHQVSVWTSAGGGFEQNTFLATVPAGWTIATAGDFNGDGKSDLMWFNSTTDQVSEWTSTGSGFNENSFLATVPSGWTIAAAGDFNFDGRTDLLWFNSATDQISEWTSTGSGFDENTVLATIPSGWSVEAAQDFNGDGRTDLLLENTSTGAYSVWDATASGFVENAVTGTVPAGWTPFDPFHHG